VVVGSIQEGGELMTRRQFATQMFVAKRGFLGGTLLFVLITFGVNIEVSSAATQGSDDQYGRARREVSRVLPIQIPSEFGEWELVEDTFALGRVPTFLDEKSLIAAGVTPRSIVVFRETSLKSPSGTTTVRAWRVLFRDASISLRFVDARTKGPNVERIEYPKSVGYRIETETSKSIVQARDRYLGGIYIADRDEQKIEASASVVQGMASAISNPGQTLTESDFKRLEKRISFSGSFDASKLVSQSFGTIVTTFGLIAISTRLWARFRLRGLPMSEGRVLHKGSTAIVNASRLARRRRIAVLVLIFRRWIVNPVLILIFIASAVGANDSGVLIPRLVALTLGLALLIFLPGRLLHKWPERGSRLTVHAHSRPKGYGRVGKLSAWLALKSVATTVFGCAAVVGSVFGALVVGVSASSPFFRANPIAEEARSSGQLLVVSSIVLLLAAALPLRRLRAQQNYNLSLSARNDPRPTVLFLRSFGDDSLRLRRDLGANRLLLDRYRLGSFVRFEEVLVHRLWNVGPVVAVGERGKFAGSLGATRAYFDDDWTLAVPEAIANSAVVCASIGTTTGVTEELKLLGQSRALKRTVFVLPPVAEWRDRLSAFLEIVGVVNSPPPGVFPIAITVDPRSRIASYFLADRSTESAYGGVLDLALASLALPDQLDNPGFSPRMLSDVPPPRNPLLRRLAGLVGSLMALLFFILNASTMLALPEATPVSGVKPSGLVVEPLASVTHGGSRSVFLGSKGIQRPGLFERRDITPRAADIDDENKLVVVLDANDRLFRLNSLTGSTASSQPVPKNCGSVAIVKDEVILSCRREKRLVIVRGATSRIVPLSFHPKLVRALGSTFLVTDVKGGWVRFDGNGKELRRTSTEYPIGLGFAVGEKLVLIEQISFRRWILTESSEVAQALDDVQGIPVPISSQSFAIFSGNEIVQYEGTDLRLRRRMAVQSSVGDVAGSVDHSLVVVGADGDWRILPICGNFTCTRREFRKAAG
jgi:hypothetical protein